MNKSHILFLLLMICQCQMYIHGQSIAIKGKSDLEGYYPKYATGINLYSHFGDYQLGGFSESIIEFSGEFGRFVKPSIVLGFRLHNAILIEKGEVVISGGTNFRLSLNPYFRYYMYGNLFSEASIGVGYGFNKFRNESGGLLREWENLLIYRYHFATGYDIDILKNKTLVIRPMIYIMQRHMKTPQYEEMPKNNKETETGISISFIINIYTP